MTSVDGSMNTTAAMLFQQNRTIRFDLFTTKLTSVSMGQEWERQASRKTEMYQRHFCAEFVKASPEAEGKR